MNRAADDSGLALVAVLIVLSLLLALGVPFVLSMGYGEDAVLTEVDRHSVGHASKSVRELLLADAAMGHDGIDLDPLADGRNEFPARLDLPEAFAALREDGKVRLGGELWDLQRKIHLNTASPLVLANLLGLASPLDEQLEPDAEELVLEDGSAFPEEGGYLFVDGEVIGYQRREGPVFTGLTRNVTAAEPGEEPGEDRVLREGELVYDQRILVAVTLPFTGRSGGPGRYEPYRSVRELAEVERAGFGGFTAEELAVFERHCRVAVGRDGAAKWGKAERVFNDPEPGGRVLLLRSAFHVGPGSVVRLRRLDGEGPVEHALVVSVHRPGGRIGTLNTGGQRLVQLHAPLIGRWPAQDTVVEPLVPHPVNVNTAAGRVLYALVAHIGNERSARPPHGEETRGATGPAPIRPGEATAFVDRLLSLRGDFGPGGDPPTGPFTGWEDLARRLFEPMLAEASSTEKQRWLRVYRNLRIGRDERIAMGTAPIVFRSGPLVAYRAAASRSRTRYGADTAAREERRGIALAMPGHALDRTWSTQQALEEALRLDRHAPWYLTTPINTAAGSGGAGTTPAPRYGPHLFALLFPEIGFGRPRFPSPDGQESGFEPAPSSTPFAYGGYTEASHDAFSLAYDPHGRSVPREGVYLMANSGPREPGEPPPDPGGGHDRVSFPFTEPGGVVGRMACSFWVTPRSLADQGLFDLAADEIERNRIRLHLQGGNLVFEVFDEAGLDPDPALTGTSPDRPVATWEVPVSEIGLRPDVPFHVALSAYGSRPGDMSLLIDNVPRGRPRHVTYLTAPVPVFDPANRDPGLLPTENPRYDLRIRVESTEGFPPRGTIRIGHEIFEYTSLESGVFDCSFVDSMGGRAARMSLREFMPDIPLDDNGQPTVDPDNLPGNINLAVAPEHPVGAAVELYGYSVPLQRDTVLQPGEGGLAGGLGAFAVARAGNRNPDPVVLQPPAGGGGGTFTVGWGFPADTPIREIELADPVATTDYPPAAGSEPIVSAFPASGGYGLLVQRREAANFNPRGSNQSGAIEQLGGIEVFRYTARQGNRLTGVTRNVRLEGANTGSGRLGLEFTGEKNFVLDWADNVSVRVGDGTEIPADEVPTHMCYVVPISIPVQGDFIDPSTNRIEGINQSEWVQIYDEGDETLTEWVRYDLLREGDLLRANRASWSRLHFELTRQSAVNTSRMTSLGGTLVGEAGNISVYGSYRATSGYIGHIPRVEEDFPQVHRARRALGFRGDPFTGTSSHDHAANARVTQCHRMALTWGNYAAFAGRVGRNDRVALISGSSASGTSRPEVEWHSVNWSTRRFGRDRRSQAGRTLGERLGPYPFQLVALKEGVRGLFAGPAGDAEVDDVRFVDRMVKYPSGELPAAWPREAAFGGGRLEDLRPVDGTVDEAMAVDHRAPSPVLYQTFTEDAREFVVRPDLHVEPGRLWVGGNETALFPQAGGLVAIDGEIIAYQSHADGRFRVASDGRGLLGTEPRGHDEGATVHFLTHVPAVILAEGVGNEDPILPVQSLGFLPRAAGTVLIGREELAHYTWTRSGEGGGALEMPRWFDPGRGRGATGEGLLRARYGTAARSASAGEALIFWPVRAWDRYRERADDPELAHFQLTHGQGSVLYTGLHWEEEVLDPAVDVECMVRIDRRGRWDDAPEEVEGLYRFRRNEEDDGVLPLLWSGRMIEVRFSAVYAPGAFDPGTFRAQAWKTSPHIENVRVEYEGETHVLEERVTAR